MLSVVIHSNNTPDMIPKPRCHDAALVNTPESRIPRGTRYSEFHWVSKTRAIVGQQPTWSSMRSNEGNLDFIRQEESIVNPQ